MTTNSQKKILSIPLAIALFVLVISSEMKTFYCPMSFELKLASLIAIGVLYFIRYWFKNPLINKDTAKVIMVLSWVLLSVFALFKMTNLIYVRVVLEISGISWLVLEFRDIIRKKTKSERANIPQLIGMFISIIYLIFKLKHWPFAGPVYLLYLIALILFAIGFLLDLKELTREHSDQS